jgi:hypothetical protein
MDGSASIAEDLVGDVDVAATGVASPRKLRHGYRLEQETDTFTPFLGAVVASCPRGHEYAGIRQRREDERHAVDG